MSCSTGVRPCSAVTTDGMNPKYVCRKQEAATADKNMQNIAIASNINLSRTYVCAVVRVHVRLGVRAGCPFQ